MATSEEIAAKAADYAARAAFNDWQKQKDPETRQALKEVYQEADAEAKRLWNIVGPDPIIEQLKKGSQEDQENDQEE